MVECDHEIIAHFLCKLQSLPAYDHLTEILKGAVTLFCGALCANCAKDMDKEIPEGNFEHVLLNIFDIETDEKCNNKPAGIDIIEGISERVKRHRTAK